MQAEVSIVLIDCHYFHWGYVDASSNKNLISCGKREQHPVFLGKAILDEKLSS